MKINIGEIEVNYELTEYEKNILTSEEREYYKFINENTGNSCQSVFVNKK